MDILVAIIAVLLVYGLMLALKIDLWMMVIVAAIAIVIVWINRVGKRP